MIRLLCLIDTDMKINNNRDQKILNILRNRGNLSSSEIHRHLLEVGEDVTLVTIKRSLTRLKEEDTLRALGAGRSVVYAITEFGKLISDVDAVVYCAQEPDLRQGAKGYNFGLFEAINFDPFSSQEAKLLSDATKEYHQRIQNISDAVHKKELERFVIELSWKSSKIEGNTYTLLDTERLLLQGIEAPGHSKDEALMILNHKNTFTFIHENKHSFASLTKTLIQDVHRLLVEGFSVNTGFRSKPVGVTGSIYRPLDNSYQIEEAIEALIVAIERMTTGYGKALIALLGLSYIQPFEDGNKRTARIMANAILLAYQLAPLSYRSVDEKSYREAMLVFYELQSFVPFKKLFIEQYDFAARNYLAV